MPRALSRDRERNLRELHDCLRQLPEGTHYVRSVPTHYQGPHGPVIPVSREHAASLIVGEWARLATSEEIAEYEQKMLERSEQMAELDAAKKPGVTKEMTQILKLLIEERDEKAVQSTLEREARKIKPKGEV